MPISPIAFSDSAKALLSVGGGLITEMLQVELITACTIQFSEKF